MTAARSLAGSEDAAARLAELRTAALADEHGTALDAKLATAAV
jgi:indolepyruvate ferredoxin oxidoreductase beta subunit